jgi:hypothetical protein
VDGDHLLRVPGDCSKNNDISDKVYHIFSPVEVDNGKDRFALLTGWDITSK